jgi:hypothetical protein
LPGIIERPAKEEVVVELLKGGAMLRKLLILAPAIVLGVASLLSAQSYGRLIGVARDAQGGVLPGVTVTLSGGGVIGERVATSDVDGSYRFQALPPGTYNLKFDMSGFKTLNREGIIITTAQTITVDVTLEIAAVAETITVTGESPVVDVKTTRMGGTFDETALHDVPSATDVWAVLAQAPGVRMRGYDVGGSHKSQQVPAEAFGIRWQNRVLSDGVDSTESTGGTGFYYDYYAADEFNVSAAGADVEMTSPGYLISMSIKGGGNQFSGLYHIDYEGEDMVRENVDDELKGRGFTGNPNLLFWEGHVDVGGPVMKDKFWFYGAYNHFKIDKVISGVSRNIATDIGLFDNYTGKLSYQLSSKDTVIGYSQWGRKQKPFRGLSVLVPLESILAQDSWSWVHKAEWQRVWSDRVFSNFQLKHFGFTWPMVPNADPATNPPRIDTATQQRRGAGVWPFTSRRWKPQVTATLNYYVPSTAGSHDFKFGFDWQIDSSQFGYNSNSGFIQYRDNSNLGRPNNVDEILFSNVPSTGQVDNRDTHTDFFVQDTWTLSNRVTLNLGFRLGRQRTHFLDAVLNPDFGDSVAGVWAGFFRGTLEGRELVVWNKVAPRLGATIDLTGQGKTVFKAYYGRYYVNIADTLSAANPASLQLATFKFLDQDRNGVYNGPQELGAPVDLPGGFGGIPVSPDMELSFADEFSASVEHEVATDTSVRFSYVRKQVKDDYGRWNAAQVLPLLTSAVRCGDAVFPCPVNPLDGGVLNLARVPDSAAGRFNNIIDNFPGADYDYDTIQFAVTRRFNEKFFVQGNFDYQWRNELRRARAPATSPLYGDPIQVGNGGFGSLIWQNHNLDIPYLQDNNNWQGKILGRYVLPRDFAVSANLRFQSGWPWAPILSVSIPGSGTQQVFTEPIQNNRSENVYIFDFRFEKIFNIRQRHRLTAMVDFYNLTNSNAEINFNLNVGSRFRQIISALDPTAVKVGIRYQF